MSLTRGTGLGAYEILAAIGAGGMGEVYLARHEVTGEAVAVIGTPEPAPAWPDAVAGAQLAVAHELVELAHDLARAFHQHHQDVERTSAESERLAVFLERARSGE